MTALASVFTQRSDTSLIFFRKCVQERTLAHPAVARENSDAASEPVAKFVDSLACLRGTAHDRYVITRYSRRICREVEFIDAQNGLNL